MRITTAEVIEVTGVCNAGYQKGDSIRITRETSLIDREHSGGLCLWALGAIAANVCRVDDDEVVMASCPDPATGRGGNVIFRISTTEQE